MGLPEGKVLIRRTGGSEGLKDILKDIWKFNFTGYLKISLTLKRYRSEGFISFEGGTPAHAVYIFKLEEGRKSGRVYLGRKAAEFIWEDSLYPQAVITIHANVSLREIAALFPGSDVRRPDLIPPPHLPSPPPADPEFEDEGIAERMRSWVEKGYDLSALAALSRNDAEKAKKAIPYFEGNLYHMENIRKRLLELDVTGFEREAESVFRHTFDPERVKEATEAFGRLEQLIMKTDETGRAEKEILEEKKRKLVDEKMSAVYDLIFQYHRMRSGGERLVSCPECGSFLDSTGTCPLCMAQTREPPRYGKRLNPRYTFSTFVVGSNNRFAVAAAQAVANFPCETYNPLFIYSRSGLGKTHLLHAIGNQVSTTLGRDQVLYTSSELLETELIESLKAGDLDEFRKSYTRHQVLLIDDIQFIAGKEETQEEIFRILDTMLEEGKQLVIASDRLPKDIPSLSERLITRLECGLIVDIQPPSLETRIAILSKMAEVREFNLPQEVIELIARVCSDNVRQLEGCLNRVMAFSSLMKKEITLDTAREVLQFEWSQEKEIILIRGRSYLVEEYKPELSRRLLIDLLNRGYRGLAITREHPNRLRDLTGKADIRILWLTDLESSNEVTIPPTLERLMLTIEEFLEDERENVIMLDDIQYLISNNTFDGVVRFIRSIVDKIQERPDIFIASVNPLSLTQRDLSIFEREMEVIDGSGTTR